MSCMKKYSSDCQNPDCNEAIEKLCASFKPYPPRMTNEEFTLKQNKLLATVPSQFRSAMSHMAWEQAHSSGYEEVLNVLDDLITTLSPAFKQFEEDIRNDTRMLIKEE